MRFSAAIAVRQAFGMCRSTQVKARADFAIVAEVVRAEPGLTLRQVAERLAGRVAWRSPLRALQRHVTTGTGRLQAAGVVVVWEGTTARLWPRNPAAASGDAR
jgi:hypothetical protein